MRLTHRFELPVGIDDAWHTLRDVHAVASCMPGATLDRADDETFAGSVVMKVGPIRVGYQGEGRFTEVDDDRYRAVIEAGGRDAHGSGGAQATVTMQLSGDDTATTAELVTELSITGRPAQLGSSVISDVSGRILDDFASRLSRRLSEPEAADDADHSAAPASTPLDVMSVAWRPLLWRIIPVVAGFAVTTTVIWAIRRRSRDTRAAHRPPSEQ